MEPVQIDFMIGGNVDSEGKKVEGVMAKIGVTAKEAKMAIASQIREQKALISELESDLKKTEKAFEKLAPGREKLAAQKGVSELREYLDSERKNLDTLRVQLDATSVAYERMSLKSEQAKDTLAKLDAQGLRGSEQWNSVSKELEGYAQALKSAQMQAQVLADPNAGVKAVAGGVSALSGALTAGIGVASLFGAEQEELAKIQTRLQSAMAITLGIQEVATQLNKSNYLSVVLLTKAKNAWAAANLRVATTLGITAAASTALMVSGIGILIAGVVALIAWQGKLNKKQEEAARLNKIVADSYKEARLAGAQAAVEEKTKLDLLYEATQKANKSKKERIAAAKELKSLYPEALKNLSEEEILAGKGADAYARLSTAILAAAKARAAQDKIVENQKKILENEEKIVELKTKKEVSETERDKYRSYKSDVVSGGESGIAGQMAIEQLASNKQAEANDYEKQIIKIKTETGKLDEANKKLAESIEITDLLFNTKPAPKPMTQSVPKANAETAAKEQYDAEEELQKKILQLQQQTAQLGIDQMKDGLEKRLAQIEFDKNAELAKLEESQQAIVDAYNKSRKDEKDFKPVEKIEDVPGVKPETLQAWADEVKKITDDAEWKRVEAVNKANAEIVKLADSYGSERTQIALSYAEDIEKLEAAGQTAAAAAARAERDKKISDATAEMITTTDLYKTATDEKLLISKEATERLIEDIKQRIAAEQAAGNLSKEKAKELLDELDKTGVGRDENKNRNNPFAQLIKGLNEYKKAKADLAAKRDTATPGEFAELENAANSSLQSTAAAAGAALQGVQSILGSVVDGLDQLGMLTEEEKQTANEVIGMVGGAADIAMGIASGNPVQIIQGSIQLLVNGLKLFDKKSKDIAKEQKKRKAELESLAEAYRKLQREASKALGSDVFKLLKESIATQKKQIDEYERLIKLEEQKKKKKQKQEDIEEWKRKIAELKEGIEDTLDEIRDKLTGTDTHTMANDLASALVSAFEQGEDAAEAFGKVFDSVIRNAVLNAFKMKRLEEPINDWLNELGKYMDDGELSDWEKRMLEAQRDAIYANAKNEWEAISGLWSVDSSTSAAKGIQGEVKNISEETGTKLAGAVNAMRLNVDEIVRSNRSSIDAMGKQLAALEEIKTNTAYCKRLERMDETLYHLKVNGIKVS